MDARNSPPNPPVMVPEPDFALPARPNGSNDERRKRALYLLIQAARMVRIHLDRHPKLSRWIMPDIARETFFEAMDDYERIAREWKTPR
jgi:hypothetical protein